MGSFKAIVIEKADKGQTVSLTQFDEANLMEGDVTVAVQWSTLNYKDGLAITGRAPVVRRFPMIPGIDFAGVVESSSNPAWQPGDKVILNGWGVGEAHLGAYAEKARVNLMEAAAEGEALSADGPLPPYAEQAYADALLYLRRPREARAAYERDGFAVLEAFLSGPDCGSFFGWSRCSSAC